MPIALVIKGEEIETIGDIEAYLLNSRTGTVELYKNPNEREVVDTFENYVHIKDGNNIVLTFANGKAIHAKTNHERQVHTLSKR